jgi:hypothetical protein
MLTPNQLQYGETYPLAQHIPLQTGPIDMLFEDGDIRYLKCCGYELIRRVYVAVRDRNWGTIMPVFSNIRKNIIPGSFEISYEAENHLDEVYFVWRGFIIGAPDGTITFNMEGQAITSFQKNRIGFCVLLPACLAGKPCTVLHTDGGLLESCFPFYITSDQPPIPFTDIMDLSYKVGSYLVYIEFKGDIFEMEDQRNWTDASYKIYSTPLRCPYPIKMISGFRSNSRD